MGQFLQIKCHCYPPFSEQSKKLWYHFSYIKHLFLPIHIFGVRKQYIFIYYLDNSIRLKYDINTHKSILLLFILDYNMKEFILVITHAGKVCNAYWRVTSFIHRVASVIRMVAGLIKVITKLPNSEQSYKGKVKTHNYINRQNQSTTGKLWKP